MELLTPSLGLIIWTIISFICLGVIAYALYRLANNENISPAQKLLWLIFIILVPIFGAVIYLGSKKTKSNKATA
jgi:uncharacterized membrane protein YoaK (UPF0700 family)